MKSRWLDIGQVLISGVYGLRRSEGRKVAKIEQGQYPASLIKQA